MGRAADAAFFSAVILLWARSSSRKRNDAAMWGGDYTWTPLALSSTYLGAQVVGWKSSRKCNVFFAIDAGWRGRKEKE